MWQINFYQFEEIRETEIGDWVVDIDNKENTTLYNIDNGEESIDMEESNSNSSAVDSSEYHESEDKEKIDDDDGGRSNIRR